MKTKTKKAAKTNGATSRVPTRLTKAQADMVREHTLRVAPESDWMNDRDEVLAFARFLVAVCTFVGRDGDPDADSVQDLLYYFEKPWKWTIEHALWTSRGRPAGEDLDPEAWQKDVDTIQKGTGT